MAVGPKPSDLWAEHNWPGNDLLCLLAGCLPALFCVGRGVDNYFGDWLDKSKGAGIGMR